MTNNTLYTTKSKNVVLKDITCAYGKKILQWRKVQQSDVTEITVKVAACEFFYYLSTNDVTDATRLAAGCGSCDARWKETDRNYEYVTPVRINWPLSVSKFSIIDKEKRR
jgi:hypothetical protein